jgi:hypothetical protein
MHKYKNKPNQVKFREDRIRVRVRVISQLPTRQKTQNQPVSKSPTHTHTMMIAIER